MNLKKIIKEAAKFQNEDEAYIHVEMKEETPKIMVSGHCVAILYCIKMIINEISKRSNVNGSEIFDIIKKMYREDE